jgi:hypothetical protein
MVTEALVGPRVNREKPVCPTTRGCTPVHVQVPLRRTCWSRCSSLSDADRWR